MLDLVFLVLMIITLVKAIKGDYSELLCNISLVVGILAGIFGIISAFFGNISESFSMGMLNILVIIIAFALRPAAKHFAQLYQNKLDEQQRLIEEEIERARANNQRGFTRDASYINAEPSPHTNSGVQGAVQSMPTINSFGANGAVPDNQSSNGFGANGAVPDNQSSNGFGANGAIPGNQSSNAFGANGAIPGNQSSNSFGAKENDVLPKK